MYVKNNFSNYFVLATILVYVLGFTFDSWHTYIDRNYSSIVVSLQAATIGIYSLFYENGFLNANPYYQVFVIALITSYQTVVRAKCNNYQYYIYARYFGVAWAAFALVLYNKLPKVLNYILRYEICFSMLLYILIFIPPYAQRCYDTNIVIAAGLSLVFVFISYLTFARIAYYSSAFIFSHMVARGLVLLISYIPYVPYRILYENLVFNIITCVVFLAALGYQYMNNRPQGVLLGSDTPNYGSIEAEV
jgi:hypothetical protein